MPRPTNAMTAAGASTRERRPAHVDGILPGVKRSISVQIAGVRYSLKTDEDDRWVKALAAYVDGKIRETQKHSRTPDTQSVAVLTAQQIADELFRERRETGELRKRIREKSQSLLDYLERQARV
jgi:cell division protein ZapA